MLINVCKYIYVYNIIYVSREKYICRIYIISLKIVVNGTRLSWDIISLNFESTFSCMNHQKLTIFKSLSHISSDLSVDWTMISWNTLVDFHRHIRNTCKVKTKVAQGVKRMYMYIYIYIIAECIQRLTETDFKKNISFLILYLTGVKII